MIKDDNGGNICKNCGVFYGYDYSTEYVDFNINKYRIYKKSIYRRKYLIYNKLDSLCINEKYQISCNEREKVINVFNEIDKILSQINQNRKRMININFLLKKIFNTLNIDVKEIPISKSKNTLHRYENYWNKILLLIGDKFK